MKRGLVAFAFALVACTRPASTPAKPAENMLHGHVFDEAGRPLPLAHVTLRGARREVARDGSFSIAWAPGAERLTRLTVSGAAHRSAVLVLAREDHDLDVTVKLGAPAPQGEVHPGVLLFAVPDPKPQEMTKDADGTWVANLAAPDGRYGYAIIGVLNEGPSGVPTDGYELTPEGTYQPQIVVKGGAARLRFDPRNLHSSFATIDFAQPTSTSAVLTAIALRVAHGDQKNDEMLDAIFHASGGPPPGAVEKLLQAEREEWSAVRKELAVRAKTGSPTIVRQLAAIAYFHGTPIESPSPEERAMANRLLDEIPPDDAIWASPGTLENVLKVAGPPRQDYAKAFIAKQPDDLAVSHFLFEQLEEADDPAESRKLFTELQKPRYAKAPEHEAAAAYDPNRPLAPGKAVQFDVKSLTSADRLTPNDFRGRVFLIDLWGTWCPGCVAELPRMHELYAKYGGKRFEILSLAAEHDAEKVTKFRAEKSFPMPWKHGIVDPETFLDDFAGPGMGYPTYVLVDDKGTILKSSPQLHPRDLPKLIEQALR